MSLTSPPTAKAGNNSGLNLYKGAVSIEAAPFLSSTPGEKRTAENAENTTAGFNVFVFSLRPLRFIFHARSKKSRGDVENTTAELNVFVFSLRPLRSLRFILHHGYQLSSCYCIHISC